MALTALPVTSEYHITKIDDSQIDDGSYVVFDWDNTLKLYNKETRKLSSRVSREFLEYLKNVRKCHLFIISAIRPSPINLQTIFIEIERLGLKDIFAGSDSGKTNGMNDRNGPNQTSNFIFEGNVILCGYDKAETFLNFCSSSEEKVVFFDDEEVNIFNFRHIFPQSKCYLCMPMDSEQ